MEYINTAKKTRECPGCKTVFPYQEDLDPYQVIGIARYGVASPECIATFCEILGKEQEWFGYPPAHRLIVDAYAIQHPAHLEHQKSLGISKRFIDAGVQSVPGHLIALYCAIELKIELPEIAKILDRILTRMTQQKVTFEYLESPSDLGKIKAIDVLQKLSHKCSLEEYTKIAWDWSYSAWDAWAKDHKRVKELYALYGKNGK